MGTTANEALEYPDSTDNANLWEHFQTLADDVDASLTLRRGRGLMTAPTSTSSDGTAVTTTETRDSVLGNYTFTAVASRRYRVTLSGCAINTSVAADRYNWNIRDGGAGTPTNASTVVASGSTVVTATGTAGRMTQAMSATFTPSAGTRTLAFFLVRSSGTGTGTPTGTRELYVEDIGPA